jgi:hypothetical protein
MLLCGILRLVVDAYVSAMSAINTREYSPCNARIYATGYDDSYSLKRARYIVRDHSFREQQLLHL